MDGVLIINKPSGLTSHDVVQRARRICGEKRIGHTGTLDPLATGVLVLCVGKATRIAHYLEAGEKEYRAVMRLGTTTDTLDAEGKVLETKDYSPPEKEAILQAMRVFTGAIAQQPPVFSALKVRGVPSYKLARQGTAAPLKPRTVTIHSIELTDYKDPYVSFTVRCSKGTYIRSLCADLGKALGMGAHLTELQRTRSGQFSLERASTLEQLASSAEAGSLERVFISVDEALGEFPEVTLTAQEARKICHGNPVPCPGVLANSNINLVRLHDDTGRLIALARPGAGMLKPELVFL